MSIITNGDMGLTGKSIVLVGSGKSLLASEGGKYIDGHDRIVRIRMADLYLGKFSRFVGSSVDILAQNGASSYSRRTIKELQRIRRRRQINGMFITNSSRSSVHLSHVLNSYNIPNVIISLGPYCIGKMPELTEFFKHYPNGNMKPSTGFRVFALLMQYDFKHLTLAGFDRFHSKGGFGRFYDAGVRRGKHSDHKMAKIHDFDLEQEIMQASVDSDCRIEVL